MPKELKEFLREDLIQRCIDEDLGEDFIDKIADETIGTTVDEIIPFLEEKGHPCFNLESLM
jgi:acetyl-CoA synthase